MEQVGQSASKLDSDTSIQSLSSVTATSLGDGMALLDMNSSTYYQLNALGAFVWNSLGDPIRLGELVALIRATFDVGDADVDRDVAAMVDDLVANGLVIAKNADAE